MKRISLFLATNLAILLVMTVTLKLLGVEQILDARGTGLNLNALLLVSAILGMSGSFVSLLISKRMAKASTGAIVISTPKTEVENWLMETVRRQARAAGIGMPEVAIYRSPDMNAFATGANRDHALVAVSTGILDKMSAAELEAVLGHEISHVANGDMVTLSLLQGVVNTFVIFLSRVVGFIVDRVVFKVERGHGPGFWITVIIAQVLLGILASIIVMWFSRQREFRADAGGAQLAGRTRMIAALRRLQQDRNQPGLPDSMAAFGVSGARRTGLRKLLLTHPPLEERIAALENAAGHAAIP